MSARASNSGYIESAPERPMYRKSGNSYHTVESSRKPGRKMQVVWRTRLANLAMLLYGAGWSFAIPLVGQLFVAEAVALAVLPFLSPIAAVSRSRNLRIILFGYCMLLLGLVISDIVNETGTLSFLRGWANIAFAIINTLFMVAALRVNLRSFHYYLAGIFLAMLVIGSASYAQRGGYVDLSIGLVAENFNMFKVRFVPFLMPLLMLIAIYLYRRHEMLAAAIFGISAIAFFMLDARSSGLTLLAAATILIIKNLRWRFSPARLVALVIALALIGQIAFGGYVYYSLRHNPYGHNASQLSRMKNPYNPFELILIGRSEWLISAVAISEKPLWGHGSWAYDRQDRYRYLLAQKTGTLKNYWAIRESNSLIPAHSVLVMAWLWGGLLGFVGWLIFFKSFVALGFSLLRMKCAHDYLPPAVLMFCGMAWDLFFSPIQALRLSFPQGLALLLMLDAINRAQLRKSLLANNS